MLVLPGDVLKENSGQLTHVYQERNTRRQQLDSQETLEERRQSGMFIRGWRIRPRQPVPSAAP